MNPFIKFKEVLKNYISDKSINELSDRWNETHRFYHNTNHLKQILEDIS